ncbi:MAG TPA: hypothetical protein VNC78_01995 [Actinomycetota bacterium]|nr:hypothetical protein [Actinomycetota bacterium]
MKVADDVTRYPEQPRERVFKWDVVDSSPRDEEGLRDDLLGVVGWYSSLCVPQDPIGMLLVKSFDEISRMTLQGRLLGRPTTPYVRHSCLCFTF